MLPQIDQSANYAAERAQGAQMDYLDCLRLLWTQPISPEVTISAGHYVLLQRAEKAEQALQVQVERAEQLEEAWQEAVDRAADLHTIESYAEEVEDLERQLAEAQQLAVQHEQTATEAERKLKQVEQELETERNNALKWMQSSVYWLNRRGEVGRDLEKAEAQLAELEQGCSWLADALRAYEDRFDDSDLLAAAFRVANKERTKATRQNDQLLAANKNLSDHYAASLADRARLEAELADLSRQYNALADQLQIARGRVVELEAQKGGKE